MADYTLVLRENGGESTRKIREEYTRYDVNVACKDWAESGDWGDGSGDDVEVTIIWTVTDEDGDEVDSGTHRVQIGHDPKTKIRAVGGDPDCEHDWERDERVGCKENPGVMGLGGTAISVTDICCDCGIVRNTRHNGSQRNPGQPEVQVSFLVK